MDKKTLSFLAVIIVVMMILVVVVGAMSGGISKTIKKRFENEKANLAKSQNLLAANEKYLKTLQNKYQDFFTKVNGQEALSDKLSKAKNTLKQAEQQFSSEATAIYKKNKKKDGVKLAVVLQNISDKINDANFAIDNVGKRLKRISLYRKDWKKLADQAQSNYKIITQRQFSDLSTKVKKAQTDWPAKQADLDKRFNNIAQVKKDADVAYQNLQQQIDKNEMRDYLIIGNNADAIAKMKDKLTNSSNELSKLIDQLYYSYDKKLSDMQIREGEEVEFYHEYKVMTVDKNNTVSDKTQWKKVTEGVYKKNEKNLGMIIESKPKGKYNFEAIKTATAPGYNYAGNKHYGNWNYDHYGHRYWSYYPRYSYMPLFFYGSGWRSRYVYYDDWNNYRTYSSYGRPYYGRSLYGSKLYGTNGTATRSSSSYRNSKYFKNNGYSKTRYKTSGGKYRGSKYASSYRTSRSSRSSSYRGSSYSRSRSSGGK